MKGFIKKSLFFGVLAVVFAFSAFGAGCKKEKKDGEVYVYMPDGAPALALAGAMATDTETDGVSYRVVDPTLIKTKVTAKDAADNADICVLPLTAATKLLGSGEKYQMLGAVTHGNLYMIAKDGVQYTAENLSTLVGKTVGVIQLAEVPGLVFKTVLKKNGVEYNDLTGGNSVSATAVNLRAITGPQEVGVATDVDCFVLAEPAVTAQSAKGYSIVGDLQALYGGENGYPQAVIVAKNSLIDERAEWLDSFVQGIVQSVSWLRTADGASIVSAVSAHLEDGYATTNLKAPMLKPEVVERCGVWFSRAKDCSQDVNAFLSVAKEVSSAQATLPATAFFCTRTFGLDGIL
ncbi:MAG: ABC transporter substrate-binding protein [Clostridia bacterium]|nr:ABC transporter substrate-binding protein [Clostridia bacterium]